MDRILINNFDNRSIYSNIKAQEQNIKSAEHKLC